jgi:hypothetical protein
MRLAGIYEGAYDSVMCIHRHDTGIARHTWYAWA